MKVALATAAHLPELDVDDQLLLQALQARGIEAVPAVWDDPAVDWGAFDLCVIRSTWDYVPKIERYRAWIERVSGMTCLWNPASVLLWNTKKTYLKDLQAQNIAIVPTEWTTAGETVDFAALMQRPGWGELVVKPVVGASGVDTYRVGPRDLPALSETLADLADRRDLMIQPFLSSVATAGEQSFLFIEGRFSHAVVKRPASSDFRVQEHLGGTFTPFTPDPQQLAFAEYVLRQAPEPVLYGRVDVMLSDAGEMLLGELELVEPSMYLKYGPGSAERFAEAVAAKLAVGSR